MHFSGSVDGGGIFDDPAGRDHMGADSFRTCSIPGRSLNLTPTEEQERCGLIGRGHRMSTSDYRPSQMMRSLRDIANPKVRGGALWTAHALLTTCHTAASDRSFGEHP